MIGNDLYKADVRQFAGILLAFSIVVSYFPLDSMLGFPTGDSVQTARLVGLFFTTFLGLFSGTVAYLLLAHDWGHEKLTAGVMIFAVTSIINFVTEMVFIGADSYLYVDRFPEAMGKMGVFFIYLLMYGGLGIILSAIYAYQTGDPTERDAAFYRSRLFVVGLCVVFAGLTQFMLGCYLIHDESGGLIDGGFYIAMFVVHYPVLSLLLGLLWMFTGVYAMARASNAVPMDNEYFACLSYFQYVMTFFLINITNTAKSQWDLTDFAPTKIALLMLPIHLLPVFLDDKARNIPEHLTLEHYGLGEGGDAITTPPPPAAHTEKTAGHHHHHHHNKKKAGHHHHHHHVDDEVEEIE